MTTDDIISAVLEREGGYVNNPADRGGPTKFGITLATLSAWRRVPLTAYDVASLCAVEARDIYRQQYVAAPGYLGILDDELRALVVDSAVLHGIGRATRWLQAAVNVPADGILGPKSMAALDAADVRQVRANFTASRARSYGAILARDPTQVAFVGGWLNRLGEFIEALGR